MTNFKIPKEKFKCDECKKKVSEPPKYINTKLLCRRCYEKKKYTKVILDRWPQMSKIGGIGFKWFVPIVKHHVKDAAIVKIVRKDTM